ncbi:MAG TPA: hypothetical protein VFO34_03510 [Candidatus Acidoferrales bacterium]|nr:hypothetical protein [Candidatus Acidoferrales bacterium]
MTTGSHGAYEWLSSTEHELGDLLRACPNVVLGRFVAITSFDSGAYFLSEAEKTAGWESRGGIAYSPKILDISHLPHELFDEWYVFENSVELGKLFPASANPFSVAPKEREVCSLVNYQGFSLDAPETEALTKIFWKQMDWIRPLAYIADGTCLNFATSDKNSFATVEKALRK